MAYQIVPKISHSPYRVQGAQPAPMQLRLLEISSRHSGQALQHSCSKLPCVCRNCAARSLSLANCLSATHFAD